VTTPRVPITTGRVVKVAIGRVYVKMKHHPRIFRNSFNADTRRRTLIKAACHSECATTAKPHIASNGA
jgi:hypothetical protein